MRILMLHRQNTAVGYYRTWLPARYLSKAGHEVTWWEGAPYRKRMKEKPIEFFRKNFGRWDLIYVDRSLDRDELGIFAGYRHYSPNSKMIVDFDDDFLNVPWWNPTHNNYQSGQPFAEIGKMHLKLAEMCSVSTPVLAERFKSRTHRIMCAENCIDPLDWVNLPMDPDRSKDDAVRILYGGANGHFGDLDEAKVGIQSVIENPPRPIRLICFGAIPAWLHECARKYPDRVWSLPWVPFTDYPQAVAWGGFDIALAPLKKHPFNEAKSNIKWLEAGLQRIPFLCSKEGPYADIPDGLAIRVQNTPLQWAEGLRALIEDPTLRENLASATFEAVMDEWTLEARGSAWEAIIEEAVTRPRIVTLEDTRLPGEVA